MSAMALQSIALPCCSFEVRNVRRVSPSFVLSRYNLYLQESQRRAACIVAQARRTADSNKKSDKVKNEGDKLPNGEDYPWPDPNYVRPKLPEYDWWEREEPDFWEGPQWNWLGWLAPRLWWIGFIVAPIVCGILLYFHKPQPGEYVQAQMQDIEQEEQEDVEDVKFKFKEYMKTKTGADMVEDAAK